MSTLRPKDRAKLCSFTFADGRRCRTPRSDAHPYFCYVHARKEAQARAGEKLGEDISYFFSAGYLSACDLNSALACLFAAVVRGQVKPRTASTLAYLGQTLLQSIQLAQNEYINACGTSAWRAAVESSVDDNYAHRNPKAPQDTDQAQSPQIETHTDNASDAATGAVVAEASSE
jgi:hypothetical protein